MTPLLAQSEQWWHTGRWQHHLPSTTSSDVTLAASEQRGSDYTYQHAQYIEDQRLLRSGELRFLVSFHTWFLAETGK